jgi:hypothetical protein
MSMNVMNTADTRRQHRTLTEFQLNGPGPDVYKVHSHAYCQSTILSLSEVDSVNESHCVLFQRGNFRRRVTDAGVCCISKLSKMYKQS